MKYRIGITKHETSVDGWVFDLPGCNIACSDGASLRQLLPVVVAEHAAWLKSHGEPMPLSAFDFELDVVEEIATKDRSAADGEFAFADDLRPVTDDEVATGVRHLEYARNDLVSLINSLPDAVQDWRPPESAMARIDPWNPDVHTIREIVQDIADSDGYYIRGLSDKPEAPVGRATLEERSEWIARLRELSMEDRGRLFRPTRPWQDRPEEWTARKVIRRMINHERFHTKEIQQRLAWLLLGIPDFGRSIAVPRERTLSNA